jgi:WD40 repeat protein/serine/threonine protein kinase
MTSSRPVSGIDPVLADLTEEFARLLQAGEPITIEGFVSLHPEKAEELRRLLPTLVALANLSGAPSKDNADFPPIEGRDQAIGRLGDFRLIREVGRGGMGVVYEAIQESLGRRVALKLLSFAAALDERRLQRFKLEAMAAAQLHHPHIVPVFGVGCERGVHYYAMQFIDGRTLSDAIREFRAARGSRTGSPIPSRSSTPAELRESVYSSRSDRPSQSDRPSGPLPSPRLAPDAAATVALAGTTLPAGSHRGAEFFQWVARMGIQAAEALDNAHGFGVLHRDIKPANLLLDSRGSLWVTDFGVARLGADAGLTLSGDLPGTLRYMSPEQALGNAATLDYRSDVYSLGVTLYELLTLEPAWPGLSREAILRQIAFEEPRRPHTLNPSVPGDLETIVLKAMAKESRDRYASARDLADDLTRYLEHRPIHARRPSLAERAAKVVRRHRAIAAVTVGFLVLAVVGLTFGVALLVRERNEANRHLAEAQAAEARATDQERTVRRQLYAVDMELAYRAWLRGGNWEQARRFLDRWRPDQDQEDLRGFEWRYLDSLATKGDPLNFPRIVGSHPRDVYRVAYSPDGRIIASAGKDGTVGLRNATAGAVHTVLRGHRGDVNWVAFDREGRRLTTAGDDGTARVWDTATGRELLALSGHTGEVVAAEFLPDGQTLATAGQDATLRLWRLPSGEPGPVLRGHTDRIEGLAIAPDGRSAATAAAGQDGTVRLWDLKTGAARFVRSDLSFSVAFAPDGRTLAAGSNAGVIHLWRLTDGAPVQLLSREGEKIECVAFSPDGQMLASGGGDGMVRLWDVHSGAFRRQAHQRGGRLWSIAFAPDGRELVAGGEDGRLYVWGQRAITAGPQFLDDGDLPIRSVAFAPDGETLTAVSYGGCLSSWDLRADGAVRRPSRYSSPQGPTSVRYGRDDTLAVGGADGILRCWSHGDDRIVSSWQGRREPFHRLTWRPGGSEWTAIQGHDALVRFDARTGDRIEVPEDISECSALEWSPDGMTLATRHPGKLGLTRFNAESRTSAFLALFGLSGCLAFSPDGTKLAASSETDIYLWDLTDNHVAFTLIGHRQRVTSVAFAPDGKTLASGAEDGTVRLWHVATGREMLVLEAAATGPVVDIAFSPRGEKLAAACALSQISGAVVLWRALPPHRIE